MDIALRFLKIHEIVLTQWTYIMQARHMSIFTYKNQKEMYCHDYKTKSESWKLFFNMNLDLMIYCF